VGDRQLLEPVEGPELELVRRAFDLYARGTWSDTTLADELGLTEAGLAEIIVNPLYAGRAIRHKGRPDEEERPARFAAPIEPALFDRVAAIRAERCTRHPGMTMLRRSYPLVRLMRCIHCESTFHGDAGNGYRRVRHARRPACGPSATYRAERYEAQIATLFARVRLSESDLRQVLGLMRTAATTPSEPDPSEILAARERLQRQLNTGEITIETFSRAWRGMERPTSATTDKPDEYACDAPTRCWVISALSGATRRFPIVFAKKRSGRSSSASTSTDPRSSPFTPSRTKTRGCWGS
jgi:hypothetical protein